MLYVTLSFASTCGEKICKKQNKKKNIINRKIKCFQKSDKSKSQHVQIKKPYWTTCDNQCETGFCWYLPLRHVLASWKPQSCTSHSHRCEYMKSAQGRRDSYEWEDHSLFLIYFKCFSDQRERLWSWPSTNFDGQC